MPRKLVFIFMSIMVDIVAEQGIDSVACRNLNCEHGSPCMTSYIKGDNGSFVTRERCICSRSYYGLHCGKKLSIRSVTATSGKAHVSILCNNVSCREELKDSRNILEYSLQFWSNNATFSCSVKAFSRTDSAVLEALLPDSEYTVCVSSAALDWCTPLTDATNSSDECVTFSTSSFVQYYSKPRVVSFLVIILSSFVGFALLVLLFVIVCKRKSLCQNYAKLPSQHKQKSDVEFSLMLADSNFVPSPTPPIHPPSSPGRPQHKVSTRTSGFASFTAKNKRTITLKSVIEYQDQEADGETTAMIESKDNS